MQASSLRICLVLASVLMALACSDDATSSDSATGSPGGDFVDAGAAGGDVSSAADAGVDVFIPEEEEVVARTYPPSASLRYVFVANEGQGTVAKIDSETLSVTPIAVGRQPTVVRTISDGDVAVVLNAGSNTVSIIQASPLEDTVLTADVVEGCNELDLAPNGDFAVAWYNNAVAQSGDPIGSLQEVTFVDLATGQPIAVSVGFNVNMITFSGDGAQAFVVTDSGVSIVPLAELSASVAIASVPFGDDPLVDDIDREVQISNSGAYAVLRSSAHAGIRVVDLRTAEAVSVELPGIPTDVDLLEGSSENMVTALVALRDLSEVGVFRLADAIAGDAGLRTLSVEGPAGLVTITADGASALLFSTLNAERRIGVYALGELLDESLTDGDVPDGAVRFVSKAVRAVLVGPNAETALVQHAAPSPDGAAGPLIDDVVEAANAVSLLHVATGYAKLVLLASAPDATVFLPEGVSVALMLADEVSDVREIVLLNLTTFASRTFEMDALPEAMGVVPGTGRIFVSQRAETGRISFIDTVDGSVRHVSAFQLNAYID